jgi:hypothetical protein
VAGLLPLDVRQPTWSIALTDPLAARIPARWHPVALAIVKAIHTVAFFSIAGLILLFTWDGLRGRPRRRTGIAAIVAISETAIYASNNQVCPLAPLAKDLGARRGSVTDIFLPESLSRRIPVLSGLVLLIGMVLNLRTWLGGRRPVPSDLRTLRDQSTWHAVRSVRQRAKRGR